MPDVQRAGDGGRRGVDREKALARGGAVEAVGALALPRGAPLRLEPVERGALGDWASLLGGLWLGQAVDRIRPGYP